MTWTIVTGPAFPKDLASLPANVRGRVESFVFDVLPAIENPLRFGKIEKLKGHQAFYKVRFGNYRLGLFLDKHNKRIHLLHVLHRREIYRRFPND